VSFLCTSSPREIDEYLAHGSRRRAKKVCSPLETSRRTELQKRLVNKLGRAQRSRAYAPKVIPGDPLEILVRERIHLLGARAPAMG